MASSISSFKTGFWKIKASVWKCLGRAPLLRTIRDTILRPGVTRVKYSARNLAFLIPSAERAARLQRYKECKSPEDFLSFITTIPNVTPAQFASEIVPFLKFAASRSPVNVCEVGTSEGGTNFLLSQAIPTIKLMVGIDLYVQNTNFLRYFSRPGQELHYLQGSSCAPATVKRAKRLFAGRELDLLFIDGDHSYDGVKMDFLLYREFVREGGLIAFHDIAPDYKTRYGSFTMRWAGDVPVFWQKIKALYPSREFVENYEQDGFGIGCLEYHKAVPLPADL